MTDRSATTPYDWEHYEDEFADNDIYRAQELEIAAIFASFQGMPDPPESILEIGPGLGRITKLALAAFPMAHYSAADVALAPLAEAQRLAGGLRYEFRAPIQEIGALTLPWEGGPIEETGGPGDPQFDLVIAIEVLLHIPHEEVGQAIANMLAALAPGGHLVTCDWTKPLLDGQPIRVQNFRHDYASLYHRAGARVIDSRRTGAQTIYVVQS